MSKRKAILLVLGSFVLLIVIGCAFRVAQVRLVQRGKAARFDDFVFTVLDVQLESDERTGTLCVVTLDVRNQARRVPFVFDPANFVLLDDGGKPHAGPIAWPLGPSGREKAVGGVLPAGSRRSFFLAYPIGGQAQPASLRMTSGPLGDFLEAAVYGRQEFGLAE